MKNNPQLKDMKDIRRYIFGCRHRAIITLLSKRTDQRFTYRFRRKEDFFFVDLLTGPDNEKDYSFLGTVRKGRSGWNFRYSKKSHLRGDQPSTLGIGWFLDRLNTEKNFDSRFVEVFYSGVCSYCGRTLTTPESLQHGIGPICRDKIGQ